MKDRRILCQIKKDAHVADVSQQPVSATAATMDKESKCPVCECDPCDCGWGSYLAD